MGDHVVFEHKSNGLDGGAGYNFERSIPRVHVVERLGQIEHEKLLIISVSHDKCYLEDHVSFVFDNLTRRSTVDHQEVLVFDKAGDAIVTSFFIKARICINGGACYEDSLLDFLVAVSQCLFEADSSSVLCLVV